MSSRTRIARQTEKGETGPVVHVMRWNAYSFHAPTISAASPISCAAAMIQDASASRRVHGGELRSSESSAFSDSHTDNPHSGQYRDSTILRRLYPQRRQGFSRALGSLLIWTMRIVG